MIRAPLAELEAARVDAMEFAQWRSLGVETTDAVLTWRQRWPAELASAWTSQLGRDLQGAVQWFDATSGDLQTAARWVALGAKDPTVLERWSAVGCTIDDAEAWTHAGVSEAGDAAQWRQLGAKPMDVVEWTSVGITSPEDADAVTKAGIDPAGVGQWRQLGADSTTRSSRRRHDGCRRSAVPGSRLASRSTRPGSGGTWRRATSTPPDVGVVSASDRRLL